MLAQLTARHDCCSVACRTKSEPESQGTKWTFGLLSARVLPLPQYTPPLQPSILTSMLKRCVRFVHFFEARIVGS